MTTSDMIRELCKKMNISLAELCRCIGQTPQNFNKKLKRGTVSFEEMMAIAEALGVRYEQAFVLPDGREIKIKKQIIGGIYCNGWNNKARGRNISDAVQQKRICFEFFDE